MVATASPIEPIESSMHSIDRLSSCYIAHTLNHERAACVQSK